MQEGVKHLDLSRLSSALVTSYIPRMISYARMVYLGHVCLHSVWLPICSIYLFGRGAVAPTTKFTNETLPRAVKLWCSDRTMAPARMRRAAPLVELGRHRHVPELLVPAPARAWHAIGTRRGGDAYARPRFRFESISPRMSAETYACATHARAHVSRDAERTRRRSRCTCSRALPGGLGCSAWHVGCSAALACCVVCCCGPSRSRGTSPRNRCTSCSPTRPPSARRASGTTRARAMPRTHTPAKYWTLEPCRRGTRAPAARAPADPLARCAVPHRGRTSAAALRSARRAPPAPPPPIP